jgi:hypothetical protein
MIKRLAVFIIIIMFFSCTTIEKENLITEEEAIQIAIKYLKQLKYDDRYIIDSAVCEYDDETNYMISFKHINWKNRKPSEGIISVDKKTGEPKWIPLK